MPDHDETAAAEDDPHHPGEPDDDPSATPGDLAAAALYVLAVLYLWRQRRHL